MSSRNSQPGQRASCGLAIRRIQSHPPSRQNNHLFSTPGGKPHHSSSGAEPAKALNTPTESYNLSLQPSSTGLGWPVLKACLAMELVCHLRPGKSCEKTNEGMRASNLCLEAAVKIRLLRFILTWATLQLCQCLTVFLPDPGPLTWLLRVTSELPCHCGLPWSSLGCGWTWLPSLDLYSNCSRAITLPPASAPSHPSPAEHPSQAACPDSASKSKESSVDKEYYRAGVIPIRNFLNGEMRAKGTWIWFLLSSLQGPKKGKMEIKKIPNTFLILYDCLFPPGLFKEFKIP